MTLEQKTAYTPLTFFSNVRKVGPKVAWDLDKAYTSIRNPNLANAHRCGIAEVKTADRHYLATQGSTKGLAKIFFVVNYGLYSALNVLGGYSFAFLGGLLGAKPRTQGGK